MNLVPNRSETWRRQHRFTWIVVIERFAFSLPSQPTPFIRHTCGPAIHRRVDYRVWEPLCCCPPNKPVSPAAGPWGNYWFHIFFHNRAAHFFTAGCFNSNKNAHIKTTFKFFFLQNNLHDTVKPLVYCSKSVLVSN